MKYCVHKCQLVKIYKNGMLSYIHEYEQKFFFKRVKTRSVASSMLPISFFVVSRKKMAGFAVSCGSLNMLCFIHYAFKLVLLLKGYKLLRLIEPCIYLFIYALHMRFGRKPWVENGSLHDSATDSRITVFSNSCIFRHN